MDRLERANAPTVNAGIPRSIAVLKFGGTSVGSSQTIHKIVSIVGDSVKQTRVVVVASAASGVTDRLVEVTRSPESDHQELIDWLRTRHHDLAVEVMDSPFLSRYLSLLDQRLASFTLQLRLLEDTGLTPALYDRIISEGERLSVPLLAYALRSAGVAAHAQDSAALIRTDDTHGDATVDFETTTAQVRRWYSALDQVTVPVVTGFIGSTVDGKITTLGRSGSDYSAAVLARCIPADRFERWTDVDGIYTEDPRRNQNAKRLASIVLETAQAWNQAGLLGMHRRALDPLMDVCIPVHVRSTMAPHEIGTVIVPSAEIAERIAV